MDWVLVTKLARSGLMGLGTLLVALGVINAEQSTALINALFDVAGAASIITSVGGVIYHHWFPSAVAVQTAVKNAPEGTFLGRAGG